MSPTGERKFRQWTVIIAGCLACMTACQTQGWPSAVLPMIRAGAAGISLTSLGEAWLVTWLFVGNVFSPSLSGLLMDRLGRRNTLLISTSLPLASWCLLFWPWTPAAFASRFLAGLWVGIMFTVTPVYLAETIGPGLRGTAVALFSVTGFAGSLYESILGVYFSYNFVTILSLIVPLLLILFLLIVPESPYYYILKEDTGAARKSLKWLGRSTDFGLIAESVHQQMEEAGGSSSCSELVGSPALRKALAIVVLLALIQRCTAISLLFPYASIIIPSSYLTSEQAPIAINLAWLLSSLAFAFLMDKFNRRTLLFLSGVGGTITLTMITVWFYLRDKTSVQVGSTTWIPLTAFLAHGVTNMLGIAPIPNIVQGELFPVRVKGQASALASLTMALASGVSVYLFLPIQDSIGIYFNFLICTLFSVGAILLPIFYMIETKGKTLEQIQTDLWS